MIRLITQTRIANRYQVSLCFFIFLHFTVFFFTGLFRHWGYLTSINDLGVWDQAIWGLLNGEPFLNTSHFAEKINWLAVHFHPILLIFAPLYLIYSSPVWFILAQALALSLTAWPIYILGRTILGSEKTGLIWAGIYLVNPFLLNAGAWDFHPISMAVPFVALGLLAVVIRNFKLMLLSVFVILLCKEHMGIMIVGFGILWWINNRLWKFGMLLMSIGFLHFYIVLIIIVPAFSSTGQHVMLSEGMGHFSRYIWLGESLKEIISSLLFEPFDILKKMMFDMGGGDYLLLLMLPFLCVPVIGIPFLFPGVADLAVNMLSSNPLPRGFGAYHSVTLVPVLTAASMMGVNVISRWIKKFSVNELSMLVLIASCFMGYLLAPFPLPAAKNIWDPAFFFSLPDPRIQDIKKLVGKNASVSVQSNIGAHFSQRKEIYRFPDKTMEADAIILWLDTPTQNIHNYPEERKNSRQIVIGMLDSHLQMDRNDFLKSIKDLLKDDELGVLYWDSPWLILKRDVPCQQDVYEIQVKLETLHKIWSID